MIRDGWRRVGSARKSTIFLAALSAAAVISSGLVLFGGPAPATPRHRTRRSGAQRPLGLFNPIAAIRVVHR